MRSDFALSNETPPCIILVFVNGDKQGTAGSDVAVALAAAVVVSAPGPVPSKPTPTIIDIASCLLGGDLLEGTNRRRLLPFLSPLGDDGGGDDEPVNVDRKTRSLWDLMNFMGGRLLWFLQLLVLLEDESETLLVLGAEEVLVVEEEAGCFCFLPDFRTGESDDDDDDDFDFEEVDTRTGESDFDCFDLDLDFDFDDGPVDEAVLSLLDFLC